MIRTSFNAGWHYWVDRNAFSLVWHVPGHARLLNLPHDAMLESPASQDSPNGRNTGFRDGNIYNYVKYLFVSQEDKRKTMVLHFEGVYMNASVYVNGQRAAFCPYGYSGFDVRIDPFVRAGTDNEIRVIANNSAMTNSRWYSGGGIYRDVWLYSADLTYIKPFGAGVTTEAADTKTAILLVASDITTRSSPGADVRLETRVFDSCGHTVAQDSCPLSLFEGETRRISRRMAVAFPQLWSDEAPRMYTCQSRLFDGETALDEQTTSFGIRTLSLDAQRGLLVNGKPVKLRGACIHHDSGLLGAATYYDAEYRRVSLLKQAGFNAVRMAHNPAAPALLRACDELGVYVMDEAFDMWTRGKSDSDYSQHFNDRWEKDIEAMVRKNYNHPSVIMMSIGNEIPEIGTKLGAKTAHDMHAKLKRLDPSRFTLACVNGVFAAGDALDAIMADLRTQLKSENAEDWNVNDFLSAMDRHMDRIILHEEISRRLDLACADTDIAGYNYMTARYEPDSMAYPNRVMVGSETYPPQIARNWALVEKLPQVIGDFTWTGWDYIGEAGVGCPSYGKKDTPFGLGYPCQLAYCGDFDITGFRRPLSYYREIVFGLRHDPCIAVQNPYEAGKTLNKTPWIMSDTVSSWTFPGCEGQPVAVEVYSPGDEVELIVNGVSLGRKPAGSKTGFITLFHTAYQAGMVQAVSYLNGEVIGASAIATAGAPDRIVLRPYEGKQNGLVYIDVTLADTAGVAADSSDAFLFASCSDGADILGFGTGDPMPVHNCNSSSARAFHGRAQLILRKTAIGKDITVTVSAEELTGSIIMKAGSDEGTFA